MLKPLMSILLPCKIICISSFVCSRSVTTYLCYNLPLLQLTCVTTSPSLPYCVIFSVIKSPTWFAIYIIVVQRICSTARAHETAQFCSQPDDCSAHSTMSAAQCHSFVGNGNTINVNKQCIYEKWIYLCRSIQHTTIWREQTCSQRFARN